MGLISYTTGIPNGPNNPTNDQPNMLTNNDNISLFLAVDHIGFNKNNSGYHAIIHQLPVSDPITINGVGQLYVKNVTENNVTDTQLIFKSGLGTISRLTGSNSIISGYQWIGGVLIQWGFVNMTLSSGTGRGNINFNIPFPNNVFNVQLSLAATNNTNSSNNTLSVVNFTAGSVSPPSTTRFSWLFNGNDNLSYAQFYWTAIGN